MGSSGQMGERKEERRDEKKRGNEARGGLYTATFFKFASPNKLHKNTVINKEKRREKREKRRSPFYLFAGVFPVQKHLFLPFAAAAILAPI